MRVLIVDDDPVSIEMIAEDLRELGYDVAEIARLHADGAV